MKSDKLRYIYFQKKIKAKKPPQKQQNTYKNIERVKW